MAYIRTILILLVFLLGGIASAADSPDGKSSKCKAASRRPKCDCTPPQYPPYDLRNENQGTVKVKVFVNAEGLAEQVKIARSSGYKGLDIAAVEFFMRACYKIERDEEGKPISSEVLMEYKFEIER